MNAPWPGGLCLVALVALALLRPGPVSEAAPAGQLDDNVVLAIVSPQPEQRLQGRVTVSGYAADRRSPAGHGLNERDIRLYLQDSGDERNLFGYAVPGLRSTEVGAALGPQFETAGFRAFWETCAFPPGPYRLIAWVSSLVVPGARQFAAVDVTVEPCAPATILYERANTLAAPHALGERFADFALGLDARCLASEPECRYGIVFRQEPGLGGPASATSYSYVVDANEGTFGMRYTAPGGDPDRFTWVVPPTASPVVRRGTAANRLGIVAQGDWIRLFINGEQVGEVRDDRRPWGAIAWTGSNRRNGQTANVEFANLVVATPGSLEMLEPVLRAR